MCMLRESRGRAYTSARRIHAPRLNCQKGLCRFRNAAHVCALPRAPSRRLQAQQFITSVLSTQIGLGDLFAPLIPSFQCRFALVERDFVLRTHGSLVGRNSIVPSPPPSSRCSVANKLLRGTSASESGHSFGKVHLPRHIRTNVNNSISATWNVRKNLLVPFFRHAVKSTTLPSPFKVGKNVLC